MLCFFDRLVKLFAFLHWELATVSSTIQHSTPAVFIGHSLPPPVFICPHCTVFPPIFLSTPTTEQIFFLVFLPFISLALSFFHHNFILQIPIELCRSQSRNTSRQLEGLFYCIPSLFYVFVSPFCFAAISAAAAAPVGVKTGHGDLALVVVVVGHWLPVCTDTFTSTQTPHKHYTTQKQTHRLDPPAVFALMAAAAFWWSWY